MKTSNTPQGDSKAEGTEVPLHDCPIMGKNTEYIRTLNVKTDELGWICIWCEMAKKIRGEA